MPFTLKIRDFPKLYFSHLFSLLSHTVKTNNNNILLLYFNLCNHSVTNWYIIRNKNIFYQNHSFYWVLQQYLANSLSFLCLHSNIKKSFIFFWKWWKRTTGHSKKKKGGFISCFPPKKGGFISCFPLKRVDLYQAFR